MSAHTHHLFYTNKLFSRYNRIVAISYLGIVVAAVMLFHGDFMELKEKGIRGYQSAISRRTTNLERNISHIANAAHGVRIFGERYLSMDQKLKIPSPLAQRIKLSDDETYFHLDNPGDGIDLSMIGNLTGSGDIPWEKSPIAEEVRMALNLNPYFQVVYTSLQETFSLSNPSIYYTSAHGFRNSYPWLPSSEKHFTKGTLHKPYFTRGLPQNNPQRKAYWNEPFFDKHTGLFTLNYSVPLYDKKRFLGIASLEINAKPFKEFLDIHHFDTGAFLLLSNDGRLIASSSKGSLKIIDVGEQLFPEELRPSVQKILGDSRKTFKSEKEHLHSTVHKDNYVIFSAALHSAPWTLMYIVSDNSVSDVFSEAGSHITFIILSLSLLLVIIHILIRREFITPARQLVHHIEKESQGDSDELSKLTQEAWRPWFEAITNVFSENGRLIHDLETHIESLDETVQDRTKKLAQKNRQLEKAMEHLNIAQEQIILQEKLASLGSLTAGIAHEMKNPLNFIINFSEVSQDLVQDLKKNIPQDEQTSEILKDLDANLSFINDHGHRADNIIRSMLMHSRKHEGEKRLTDINHLLSESASLAMSGFKGQERVSDIRIIKQFEYKLPQIYVIPEDLGRVFMNLINNACYALLEKSHKSRASTLVITLSTFFDTKQKQVVIQIRDNGTGIPKEAQRKIFEPFYTTKPMGKGTGLGLSLSYDIVVQQNQGTISVASEEGAYTCFNIAFPYSEAAENIASESLKSRKNRSSSYDDSSSDTPKATTA